MGSAQSAGRAMAEQVVHDLQREDRILQERSMQSAPQRTEEERDASIIGHVHHVLRHYNAKYKGLEFVPVKPLMAAYVGFRGHIWVHVSFLARRTKKDPVKHFFAELRYDYHLGGTPTVETCVIVDDKSRHLNTTCAFCPRSFEILHPVDGKFVCGNKSQATKGQDLSHFMNLLEKPYTCPTASGEEAKEDVATQEEEDLATQVEEDVTTQEEEDLAMQVEEDVATQEEERRILSWTLVPFNNFITGFMWACDAKFRHGSTEELSKKSNVTKKKTKKNKNVTKKKYNVTGSC